MKKSDIVILFCQETSRKLHFDQAKTKELLSYFYAWTWESYTDYLYRLEEISTELKAAGLNCDSLELINCYFEYNKKFDLYERLFSFLANEKIYKKAPKLLSNLEKSLQINSHDALEVRKSFIQSKYFKEEGLKSYTQAVLSSLMISIGNDGVLDKNELDGCLDLLNGIKKFCPEFPIKSFDISNALSFIEVPQVEMKKLKKEIVNAIKSDGVVDSLEVSALKEMSKAVSVNNESTTNIDRMLPFCALAILFSDGEITLKEKEWFLANYKPEEVINNIEEAFWFLTIISKSPRILNEQQWFISMLWNREKPFYDMVNCLFINFGKYFLSFDQTTYRCITDYLVYDSSRKFKEILEAHQVGKVVEEELLLLLNLVFNDRYDVTILNEFLNKDYLSRVFSAIKSDDSSLMYYASAQSLFSDRRMSDEEYQLMWKNFESLHLDSKKLKTAVYDHSLYLQQELEIAEYYTYLRKELT
jgi:hypothetical protein